jgi:hypothetical protein
MATITFNCSKCKGLCAFKDIYAGHRARCLNCNQIFIIPASDNEKVKKVEHPKEYDQPLPGFYGAVFKYSLPAIFNIRGLATLLFVFIVTALKFFTIHLDYSFFVPFQSGGGFTFHLPVGWIIAIFVWGGIFWCYAEIICATAFDIESLPQVIFGGGAGYLFSVLKSLYSFFIALVVVMLPAIIVRVILNIAGIHSDLAVFPFIILGIFLFPIAVLAVSVNKDLLILYNPVYLITPIRKAFGPYLFVVALFTLTFILQYMSHNYEDFIGQPNSVILKSLLVILAIQILAIFTMRVAGLFYRHYACYFE